jgi:hypothetical protein
VPQACALHFGILSNVASSALLRQTGPLLGMRFFLGMPFTSFGVGPAVDAEIERMSKEMF